MIVVRLRRVAPRKKREACFRDRRLVMYSHFVRGVNDRWVGCSEVMLRLGVDGARNAIRIHQGNVCRALEEEPGNDVDGVSG